MSDYWLKADIVILGGGISGLLLAAELSKSNRVIVIEKNAKKEQQNKYWVTPSGISAPPLGHFIDRQYRYMDFISYDGAHRRVFGDFTLWNGDDVTSHLYTVAKSNGCVFLFNHHFFAFRRVRGRVVVLCEDKEIECALIVDCMGWQSPFALAFSLAKLRGYYFVVGMEVEMVEELEPTCLHNIKLSEDARYIEVFPRSNGCAFISLISPLANLNMRSEISREFHFILAHTPYKSKIRTLPETRSLFGIVPVGAIKKQAIDNVYLFGEAGYTHPAATGACLTPLLKALPAVSANLTRCVAENTLREVELSSISGGLTALNKKFQLNLYNEVLSWSSTNFSDVIKKLDDVDDEMITRVLFGDIDIASALTARNILSLVKNRNWPLLRSVARTFFI
jgi:flavin-dependent dehydrogenase